MHEKFMHKESIFKQYDIRGIYKQEFDDTFAFQLGQAVAEHFQTSAIIARDGRQSSETLQKSFIQGYTSRQECFNLGLVSTPAAYFAGLKYKLPQIIITASHNPSKYNGFKIMQADGTPEDGKNGGLQKIKKLLKNQKKSTNQKPNLCKKLDISRDYMAFLNSKIKKISKKIIIDQSGGSGKLETECLGTYDNVKIINNEIDGKFTVHSPDPLHESSKEFIKNKIQETEGTIGAILDGDADRVIFFDEKGNHCRPEHIAAYITEGDTLYDVRASRSLKDTVNKKDYVAKRIAAGRSNFISQMKESGYELGVEASGHYFYKELKGTDNAALTIIKLLNKLKDHNLIRATNFPKYRHSGEHSFKVENATKSIKKVQDHFKDNEKDNLDGLTIFGDGFWFNLRKSNTEPVIRLNLEAKSKSQMNSMYKMVKDLILIE